MLLTLEELDQLAGVRHGFFTREGGVSQGLYASLNCGFGSQDDRNCVARNRALAMAGLDLGDDALVTLYQTHSANAVPVEEPWAPTAAPRADGMATRRPGVALGILTADCAPVLLADPDARVVGAAHAGWRGALSGVIEATVMAMEGLGAERRRITAGVGPCIGPNSYEVGPEFPGPFLALDPANDRFFRPAAKAEHWLFDLPGYVADRLRQLGLKRTAALACDTAAETDRFFSYRRSCLQSEPDYGRELSAIALET